MTARDLILWRKALGLSQAQAAAAMGASNCTVAYVETGRLRPSKKFEAKFKAAILEVKPRGRAVAAGAPAPKPEVALVSGPSVAPLARPPGRAWSAEPARAAGDSVAA